VWPPAAATTACSLCRNDSGSSDPQYRDFLGREPWPGTTKLCLKIMWTAVPVSLNEMRKSFQMRSDPVLSDKCSSSIAHHAESNRHCPVNDSKFFIVVLKTSATNICFCCFDLFSGRNHNVNSPCTSSRTSSCMWLKNIAGRKLVICIFF